jgi:hypothetical protein
MIHPRFVFVGIAVAFVVWLTAVVWSGASAGEPSETGTGPEPTLPPPTTTVQLERKVQGRTARGWHRIAAGYRRKLLVRWKPTVQYAYRLAAAIYGVSYWQMHNVSQCESNHYPYARNGQYRGLFQEGPMFERGPFGHAGFSVWDPIANALTAADVVSQQGWGQWECKPR